MTERHVPLMHTNLVTIYYGGNTGVKMGDIHVATILSLYEVTTRIIRQILLIVEKFNN